LEDTAYTQAVNNLTFLTNNKSTGLSVEIAVFHHRFDGIKIELFLM